MQRRTKVPGFRAATVVGAVLLLGLPLAAAQTTKELTNPAPHNWPTVGRTLDGMRFSPLEQITPENASNLRLAWSRALPWEGSVQMTPVVYDGVMYVNMPTGVMALNAINGDLIWQYSPQLREGAASTMRGSVIVHEGKVYQARTDGVVVALDAGTGEELWDNPITNIELAESFTSGPIFADGKIILGPAGGDAGGNPGKIHAVDSENGELLWTFNIIPGPDDPEAYKTWNPKPKGEPGYGGGSPWTHGAYDPVTRTVVWGTGQPTPWDRFDIRKGNGELYNNSYVALDVDTGKIKWYHQVIPSDEWDADQHVSPVITNLDIDGESRRVAMLPTTAGWLVLIDMKTGEFIEAHNMAQKMGQKPTILVDYKEDGTPVIDDKMRYEKSGDQRMVCPFRWASWELGSYSPETGLYYRPNSLACWNLYVYALEDDWEPGQPAYDFGGAYLLEPGPAERIGGLSAINPVTGEVVWEFTTQYDQRAGAVATAGGVVFGAFADRTFRAFDAETGAVLWQQLVTSTTSGSPISYAVDGRQYVAVPIGGTGGSGREDQPPVVAGPPTMFVFALPEEVQQAGAD